MNIPTIEFEQVSFAYDCGQPVLLQADLSMAQGEKVALVGESGEGKTTILNLSRGTIRPCSGKVWTCGKSLSYKARALRHHWQRCPLVDQSAASMFPFLTVQENVEKPLRLRGERGRTAKRTATALLDRVGIRHRQNAKPNDISGGERVRAHIARSLAMNGQILLADEPTGQLDQSTARSILQLLAELEHTVLIVTHQPALVAPFCHRTIRLHQGRLIDVPQPINIHPQLFSTVNGCEQIA